MPTPNEIIFSDSALPPRMEAMGLPLADYTLRHELILLRHRSPFLCLSQIEFNALPSEQQTAALSFAIQVCAADEKQKEAWVKDRLKSKKLEDWTFGNLEFRNYLMASRQLFTALSSADKSDAEVYQIANNGDKMTVGRPMGSPFIAQLITFCLGHMHVDMDGALASPFGLVANLYFAWLESKGQIYIENQVEKEIRAELETTRAQQKTDSAAAKAALAACQTVADREAAYQNHPLIGNLFAAEWKMAPDEAARIALVREWGTVATTELERAGIDPAPYMNTPGGSPVKGTTCQA